MTLDISEAKTPDLRASLTALRRAGVLARRTAIQTETGIAVVQNGQLRRIAAEELKREEEKQEKDKSIP